MNELTAWLVAQGHEQDTADEIAQSAFVSVFDHYQTDGPGYTGKVMTVVWSGSPSVFNVFVWRNGKMEDEVHDLLAK
jgi:hypothetical protein